MRFYVDQMLQLDVAVWLRERGHDVVRASEVGQARADDSDILTWVCQESRVLLTLDEDFGSRVVLPLDEHPGVVRLKIHPPTPANVISLLDRFLRQHGGADFSNHLIIVSERKVRWVRTRAQ